MSELAIDDTIEIGKHKGRTVSDVLVNDVGYCLWLRDVAMKDKGRQTFNKEVNMLLDIYLLENAHLATRFRPWYDVEQVTKYKNQLAVTACNQQHQELLAQQSREQAYESNLQWGCW